MRTRRCLAIICFTVCICAFAFCGYISFISYKGEISYTLGFLIFLPVWIASYWFSTFFSQLSMKKTGEKRVWIIPKKQYNILSRITNLLSILLLAYWGIIFVLMYVVGGGGISLS